MGYFIHTSVTNRTFNTHNRNPQTKDRFLAHYPLKLENHDRFHNGRQLPVWSNRIQNSATRTTCTLRLPLQCKPSTLTARSRAHRGNMVLIFISIYSLCRNVGNKVHRHLDSVPCFLNSNYQTNCWTMGFSSYMCVTERADILIDAISAQIAVGTLLISRQEG